MSSQHIKNPQWLRLIQILWLAAVCLNLLVFGFGIVYAYDQSFRGEVNSDIWVEASENSAYVIWTQLSFENLPDENLLLVTAVSPEAAEAGLAVGDKIRPNWGQGRQNMPLNLSVLHPDGQESTVTLIAADLGTGYYFTFVSPDAAAAGVQVGDMPFGDFYTWDGRVGSEIRFMVLPADSDTPRSISLIRKPFRYSINVLSNLGFSIEAAALIDNGLTALVFVASFGMAFFIFFNRPHDTMALLFAWTLSVLPIIVTDLAYLPRLYPDANWSLFDLFVAPIEIYFCISFPHGVVKPRWSWLFIPAHLLINLLPPSINPNPLIGNALFFCLLFLLIRHRYQHYFNQTQRQQTKWLVYAFALLIITQLLPLPALALEGNYAPAALYFLIVQRILMTLLLLLILVLIAFAILRYRLYEIDVVINRSVVGALVVFALLLIFLPSVFIIQSLLGAENTAFSYLVSAALPALLFNPARKQIRHFVDQRIYGLKFDLNQLAAAQQKPEIKNAGALTGQHLGQYEVLDFIGKGGMGEVYKGYADGQTVALKTLPAHLAKEGDFLRRFQREAEVMQGLEHPKIVKLFASGESDHQLYLAMAFIDGIELKDYLREKGKLSLEEAREILGDIAAALDYLHSKNIVHRDIKPSNVMLRGDDPQEAILMDFGIAKIEDGKTRLTGSGAIGTIDYMAPEQIMAAKEVDKRADVYALGVIAYEMLTGERPFKGSAAQVMFAHLQQPVTEPRQHNPQIPESISSAILKALEKQPEKRFESAGAFVAALAA